MCAVDHRTGRIPSDPHSTQKSVLSKKKMPDVNFYFAHLPLPHGGRMKAMQCIRTF